MVAELHGRHCTMSIAAPAPGVVLVRITGTDTGELGDEPFATLAPLLTEARTALFVDAREARGPSVDVGDAWAQWLARHRGRLQTTMLAGSPLVAATARFVRRFAEVDLRLTIDAEVFERALAEASTPRR
jgi:hypothetical protein